jgi:engulfment/cell motility protein 1
MNKFLGIACLLEQPMVSKQMEDDYETLLSVEIKLRLLDTEGVDISKDPPPIPKEPEVNFKFILSSYFPRDPYQHSLSF